VAHLHDEARLRALARAGRAVEPQDFLREYEGGLAQLFGKAGPGE
jgi:hypothetical protein